MLSATPVVTRRGRRALPAAALLALACHGLGWGLWRQHAAQGEPAEGSAMHLSFRVVPRAMPVGAHAPADLSATRPVADRAPQPAPAVVPATRAPAGTGPSAPSSDGPVMVESGMDEALRAVSANERAAAGNAQDPFAINPDAYLPADALETQPQLAGPWQLNESAVPPRTSGAPTTLTIAMRLWVSAQGHIDAVQVLSAEPAVPWLESLLQDIAQTPLRPATEQGRAVASSWLVEWQLDLAGGM